MSTELTSSISEPVRPLKSSRTSSGCSHDLIDESTDLLTITPYYNSSKKVRICTLCGRYAGLRPVRKSSLLSFYL